MRLRGWKDWTAAGALAVMLVLLVAAIWWQVKRDREEQAAWAVFSQTHGCLIVQRTQAQTHVGSGVGLMSNGKMGVVTTTTTTPAQAAWLCDDGVTYWRNQ